MKSGDAITSESIEESGTYPVYGGNGVRGYTESYTHEGTYPIIGRQGALCGNVNVASGKFWASEHAVVVRPKIRVDLVWLAEVLRTMNLNQYSVSAAQPGLSVDAIERLLIPVPPIATQTAIGKFIACETAKIDELIAKQERLIARLHERKRALVSHAVTRGLYDETRLIDSGVDSLGHIPAHWTVAPLKRSLRRIEQGWSPECEARTVELGEWGVLKVGCVNGGTFNWMEHKALPPTLEPKPELLVREGDLLVSRANTRELVGSAAVVDHVPDRILLCDKLFRVIPKPQVESTYLAYLLGSDLGRWWIELNASGASQSMQNIGQDTIREFVVALPPLSEQRSIVDHLDRERKRISALVTKATNAINLLRERRSALISAAVTGKIDVREMAA